MEWRNRIVGTATVDPKSIAANPKNWRAHPQHQQDTLLALLREVGTVDKPIVNQPTGFLLDGHLRVALAILDAQPGLDVDYTDLSPEEEDKVLALFDPITTLAGVDKDRLKELGERLQFQDSRLRTAFLEYARQFRIKFDEQQAAALPAVDPNLEGARELQQRWGTHTGQLWEIPSIGRQGAAHRLLCGDATDPDQRARLIGAAPVALLHTDPPYGINIVQRERRKRNRPEGGISTTNTDRPLAKSGFAAGKNKVISAHVYHAPIYADDAPFNPEYLLSLAPVVILWGGNYYADKLPIRAGWIVWDKREGITRNKFADGELAWTNQKRPVRIFYHLWNGLHRASQYGEKRTHPTEKPVALFEEIGKEYAPGGIWLDLYAGTGAQLLAAERSGAVCLAMEIDPVYCAVTLDRLERAGLQPILMHL